MTRQSARRPALNWQAVSATRNPAAGQYMSMQQSLGLQLAQLSRDASAAVSITVFLVWSENSFPFLPTVLEFKKFVSPSLVPKSVVSRVLQDELLPKRKMLK